MIGKMISDSTLLVKGYFLLLLSLKTDEGVILFIN